jgi:hypothetical protein
MAPKARTKTAFTAPAPRCSPERRRGFRFAWRRPEHIIDRHRQRRHLRAGLVAQHMREQPAGAEMRVGHCRAHILHDRATAVRRLEHAHPLRGVRERRISAMRAVVARRIARIVGELRLQPRSP